MPPAQRGVPQIEVTFDIDANGILSVSAKDKGTGKEQNIRIEASTGLSQAEIEKMKAEAKANEEADKKAKERVEKLNQADTLIFQTEKQLTEFGEKVPADKKQVIEEAVAKLKEVHQAQDIEGLDTAMEALNTAWSAASQDIYQAQQGDQAGQPGGDPNAEAGGEEQGADASEAKNEAEDVEFEEVK